MTRIGSAHVSIHAKDGGFKKEVRKIVGKIDDIKIDLGLDTRQAETAYDNLKKKIEDVQIELVLDTRKAKEAYDDLKDKFDDARIDLTLDTKRAEEAFDDFKDKIGSINVDVTIDTDKARKKIDRLIEKLNKLSELVSVDVLTESAEDKIDRLSEKIDDLARSVKINLDTANARKKITYLRQRLDDLSVDLLLDTTKAREELDSFVDEALRPLETILLLETSEARRTLAEFSSSSDASISANLSLVTTQAEAKLKAFGRNQVRSIRLTINKTNAVRSLAKLKKDISEISTTLAFNANVKVVANTAEADETIKRFKRNVERRKPIYIPIQLSGLQQQLAEIRRSVRAENVYIDLALTEATMKNFRAKIAGFLQDARAVKVSVQANQESIRRTILEIKEAFEAANLTVDVKVVPDQDIIEEISGARFDDKITEIRAVANTAAAEAQLAFAARNRRSVINVNANMSTLSRLRARILNELNFDIDNSPIIRMFTGPEVSTALRKFTVSVAGVIDPSAVRDKIVSLMTNFDSLAVSAGKVSTAVGAIGTSALWGIGMVSTLATDLGKAVGILAMAPAGAAMAFTVLKTWKTAWAGITSAMVYDTEEAMKAIEKMPPAMQDAAKKLHAFTKEYSEVVTENYWAKMDAGIDTFMSQVADTMINGFGQIADGLADVSLAVVEVLAKATREGKMEVLFENIATAVHNAEVMVYHLTDAFMNMAAEGSAYLPRFVEWLGELAQNFNEFISNAISDGSFHQWIFNAVEVFQDLGTIVWDTILIVKELGEIASAVGFGGLADLATGVSNVHDWVSRTDVFTRLHQLLGSAKEGFERMAEGVGTVAETLFSKSHLISGFLSEASETVAIFMEHLAKAFQSDILWDGLDTFFKGVREGVENMGPGISDAADMVGMLAEMFGETLKYMGEGFTILMDLLKDVFIPIHEGFMALHGPMNDAFQLLTSIVKGPLVALAEVIETVMKGLALVPTPIMTLATGMLMLVGPINALRIAWGTLTGKKFVPPKFAALASQIGAVSTNVGNLSTKFDGVRTSAKNIYTIGSFDKMTTGVTNVNTKAGLLRGTFQLATQTVGGLTKAVGGVVKSMAGAIFNPVTLGFAAITGAITLWQGIQEGIKQAKQYSDDLAKSYDPLTGTFKDLDAAVDSTVGRLEQMKSGTFFSNGKKILEEAGISAEKFSENLLKLDQIKMDKLRNEINMAKEAFEDSRLRGKAVSEAVAMMSDETIASMDTTREALLSMSQTEFRAFIATAKEGADNIGAIAEKAKPLREELNNVGAALSKAQWDKLEKPGKDMQGWRDAVGRANDQIGVMIENFNTLESKTSTVEQKFSAMTSNMEMMRLDTSAWNDPLEKMWQAAENSKTKFQELKEMAKKVPVDYSEVVKLEGSFDGATHAAFNFSRESGAVSQKLNQIMGESSEAIKQKFIGAFDQAIQSGKSYSEAMNIAFNDVSGDIGSLQKSLRDIGVPEDVINGLLDTFGILEGDLKKSIDIENKDQAKRDLIEIELAAEAIKKGDYSVYLDFVTKDAEDNITKFLGKATDVKDVRSKFHLDNVDQAKDLLQGLASGEWPVNAILQIDDLDAREKKRLLEQEIIRLKAEIEGMDAGPELSALKTQLEIAQRELGIDVDVDADTGKVKPKVDGAVAEASSGAKVDVGVRTGGIVGILKNAVGSAVDEANSSSVISPGVDDGSLFSRVGSAVNSAIGSANSTATITPDADTTKAGGKIGNWVTETFGTARQMMVDADTNLGKQSVGELANTAETGAKFPINLDLGQLEHMRGVLRHYQNSTIQITAKVSMGQIEHLRGVLRTYQSTRINVTTSVSMGQIEHLRGVLRTYQSTRINVTTSVSMGQIEHMRGVLKTYRNPKVSVTTSVSMGQIEHLRGVLKAYKTTSLSVSVKANTSPVTNLSKAINNIPKRTVKVSVDVASPNTKIDALSRKIKAVPDKKFKISVDTGQPQTDVRHMVKKIEAIPDKKFKISVNTGQPQTDVRMMVKKIREIPDKKFKITADITQALNAIYRLNNASVSNKSRTITTYTRNIALSQGGMLSGSGVQTFANGGINSKVMQSIAAFAGGSEKHVAQIAKGGYPYRVWAEPETGGEAYIPLAKAKRSRSTDILEKVAKHFGYSLVRSFSEGGVFSGTARNTGVQSFASGGATSKIRVPSGTGSKTAAEAGKQLVSDLANIFNQLVDNMGEMFVKRKSTPLIDALTNMSQALTDAIAENGFANRAMSGRAMRARASIMRNSHRTGIWNGGVSAGLNSLSNGINSNGSIRRGYNFTLRDIEYGLDRANVRLESAKKKLDELNSAYNSVVESISSKAREPFSLSNSIQIAQESNQPVTVKTLTKSAKAVVARNLKFRKVLLALRDKGFPPGLLQEVAALGPGEGIPVAEELAKSSTRDILDLKTAYDRLDNSALEVGKTVGNAMYKSGIDAASGLVLGLESQIAKMEKAGQLLSDALIRSFKAALGIKSPSRVMRDQVGAQIGAGLALGILDSISNVENARAKLQGAIDMSAQVKDSRNKRHALGLTDVRERGNNVVYNITTNNPLPETPSETLRKNNRTLSLMGL